MPKKNIVVELRVTKYITLEVGDYDVDSDLIRGLATAKALSQAYLDPKDAQILSVKEAE